MLIKFTCENFLSFGNKKDAFEFLNTATSKTKNLPHHIAKISKEVSVLRGAVIYGANASGKTNFIKAIAFAKNIIQSHKKGVDEHKLSSVQNKFCKNGQSKFAFDFALEDALYEYGFEINSKEVVREWLKATNLNGKREKVFFERQKNELVSEKEIAAIVHKEKKDKHFFEYCKKSLKPNQLMLHRLCEDNIKFAQDLTNWFKKIAIVNNFNHSGYFTQKELFEFAEEILMKIDKQIEDISFKEEKIEKPSDILGIPLEASEKLFSEILDRVKSENDETLFTLAINNSESKSKKIYLSANNKAIKQLEILIKRNGEEFTLAQESDGIRRIFDLIPILFSAQNGLKKDFSRQSIFIIDEIERSLHPHIARELIKMFFDFGKNSQSQLIFTTHDTNLLDRDLFRKDEIWFAEKNKNLSTQFTSLADFKDVRDDLVISKGYLQGRFGAIPFIGNWGSK